MRVLFVSNGHGEDAIAARIAAEAHRLAPMQIDHLALVGDLPPSTVMRAVGPRRAMPSGGLIAMWNFRNFVADVGAGIVGHTARQWRFLRESRHSYDALIAVGDTFVLGMALAAGCRTLYVGTAKSVYVAPYGPLERMILKRAVKVFVRDEATAASLRRHRVHAQAAGNVIADIASNDAPNREIFGSVEMLTLLPGSREAAYRDGVYLAGVLRRVARARPRVRGALSVAPGLRADTFVQLLRQDGWLVKKSTSAQSPFEASCEGRPILAGWAGEFTALFPSTSIVLGQAGTANEAAAAAGIPIIAFEERTPQKSGWYRMRQARLLGDAVYVADRDVVSAAAAVNALLEDPARRAHMSRVGRQRMGRPGGASRIARQLVNVLHRAPP